MTTALFRTDPTLGRCTARVTALTPEGGIVLDQSVFYPTGGGQPGDAGLIRVDATEIAITTAVKGEGDDIVHLPAPDAPAIPIGTEVEVEIDAATRARYCRVHTCLHLLSVVIPLPVSGGSIAADKGRLDFDMPEAPEDKGAIEDALNTLIAADHAVTEDWITDEELAANPGLVKTMSVKPPVGQGRVRLVRIGTGETQIDLQPCGGTHVASTAAIGKVRIGKVEKKGKRNRRVYVHLID
ncbi:MAG: alanyl-tRNA editing protein [Pseudomonadota bacterium]